MTKPKKISLETKLKERTPLLTGHLDVRELPVIFFDCVSKFESVRVSLFVDLMEIEYGSGEVRVVYLRRGGVTLRNLYNNRIARGLGGEEIQWGEKKECGRCGVGIEQKGIRRACKQCRNGFCKTCCWRRMPIDCLGGTDALWACEKCYWSSFGDDDLWRNFSLIDYSRPEDISTFSSFEKDISGHIVASKAIFVLELPERHFWIECFDEFSKNSWMEMIHDAILPTANRGRKPSGSKKSKRVSLMECDLFQTIKASSSIHGPPPSTSFATFMGTVCIRDVEDYVERQWDADGTLKLETKPGKSRPLLTSLDNSFFKPPQQVIGFLAQFSSALGFSGLFSPSDKKSHCVSPLDEWTVRNRGSKLQAYIDWLHDETVDLSEENIIRILKGQVGLKQDDQSAGERISMYVRDITEDEFNSYLYLRRFDEYISSAEESIQSDLTNVPRRLGSVLGEMYDRFRQGEFAGEFPYEKVKRNREKQSKWVETMRESSIRGIKCSIKSKHALETAVTTENRHDALEEEVYCEILLAMGFDTEKVVRHVEAFMDDPTYEIIIDPKIFANRVKERYLEKWREVRKMQSSDSIQSESESLV